jgi:hypothetical protein
MKTLERQLRHSNAERWNDAKIGNPTYAVTPLAIANPTIHDYLSCSN